MRVRVLDNLQEHAPLAAFTTGDDEVDDALAQGRRDSGCEVTLGRDNDGGPRRLRPRA